MTYISLHVYVYLFPPSSLLLLSEASSSLLPQLTKQCKRPQHPGNGSLKPQKSRRRNGKIRTCFKANPEPYGKDLRNVGSDSEKHDTVTDSLCEWTDFQSYLCSLAQLYPMAAYSVPYLNYVYHQSLTETDFSWEKAASGMFISWLSQCLFLACKLLMLMFCIGGSLSLFLIIILPSWCCCIVHCNIEVVFAFALL